MSTLRVTLLGTGSSGGIPRADGDWGQCDPNEPKNRRSRCSLLVQLWKGREAGAPQESTTVIIDTAPEFRDQAAAARISHLDGILYSHDHADQTHGIDDTRAIVMRMRKRIRVWMDGPTRETMMRRFGYCFVGEGAYPPILEDTGTLEPGAPVVIEGAGGSITFTPLRQDHGNGVVSLGFRFFDVGYSNDVVALPEETMAALGGLKLWIADALRRMPHPTHAHLGRTLEWQAQLKPEQAVLTNMHLDMDYQTLLRELPDGVEPGYDGWALDLTV
ncbi:MAG: MBL fold metallo-hydrolase [Caulobacterales bacterium]